MACPQTRSYLVLGVLAERVKGKSTRQARHWHGRAGHADVAEGAGGGEVPHDQEIGGGRRRRVKKYIGGRRIRGDRSANKRWCFRRRGMRGVVEAVENASLEVVFKKSSWEANCIYKKCGTGIWSILSAFTLLPIPLVVCSLPGGTLLNHARMTLLLHPQSDQRAGDIVKRRQVFIAAQPVQHRDASLRHQISSLLTPNVTNQEKERDKDKVFCG